MKTETEREVETKGINRSRQRERALFTFEVKTPTSPKGPAASTSLSRHARRSSVRSNVTYCAPPNISTTAHAHAHGSGWCPPRRHHPALGKPLHLVPASCKCERDLRDSVKSTQTLRGRQVAQLKQVETGVAGNQRGQISYVPTYRHTTTSQNDAHLTTHQTAQPTWKVREQPAAPHGRAAPAAMLQ